MENVRVKRAGFAFRQEYDVALERYTKGFSLLFSQEDVVHICKAVPYHETLGAQHLNFYGQKK